MNAAVAKAVITGGEGDLAREIASGLTADAFQVDSPGRKELDVTRSESVHDYFSGREIDLLICNAGITRDHHLARLTEKDWNEVIEVNLKGVIRCVDAAHDTMKGRGGGSIVLISSHSAQHPPVGQTAYATAKAALLGLTTDLARELGTDNIRVNAILPGFLETKMTAKVSDERKQAVVDEHALKRLNTCREVTAFIRTLHRELIHTSGQIFQLDSRC